LSSCCFISTNLPKLCLSVSLGLTREADEGRRSGRKSQFNPAYARLAYMFCVQPWERQGNLDRSCNEVNHALWQGAGTESAARHTNWREANLPKGKYLGCHRWFILAKTMGEPGCMRRPTCLPN